jgi:hypothetical protein
MRCYFHLVKQTETIPDEEGIEVLDLFQGRQAALRAAEELLREDKEAAAAAYGWRLDVSDASGDVLFSIWLDDLRATDRH